MLAPQILALMLAVGPAPGASPYSVVPTTSTAKPCAGHTPLCRRPWYDAYHKSLVRQENADEGLLRYYVIAQAIAAEAGKDDRLARVLLTITLHESGWRRDVMSCRGRRALGDGGRSYSIAQARLGRGSRAGWRLCGVTLAAARRAVGWAAKHLRRCTGDAASVLRCYGGVSRGERPRAISARVASYRRFLAPPKPLSAAQRKVVGLTP